jgi:hypothetical protein
MSGALIAAAWAAGGPPPIIGGEPSPTDAWPDAVAVFTSNGFVCSGTLIAPDLVLTAGHCIVLTTHVKVGSNDHLVDGEQIAVVREVEHPDSLATFDVGLLQLETPASVAPRGLLVDCLSDFLVDGATTTAVGFGRTDAQGTVDSTQLRQVQLPVHDADCSDLSRGCRTLVSPGGELVAGGDGSDSCTGDSGGPLYLRTSDGRAWLAGVVSRGAFPAQNVCGDGGIFVRTDAVLDWIEAEGGVTLPRPDCAGLNRPPQVQADVLRVTQGRSAPLPVRVEDPDGDGTSIEVLVGPERGGVDDQLVFHAEPFQVGPDRVRLRVVDDGEPPQAAEVVVEIQVLPAGHLPDATPDLPRGCQSTNGPSWMGWSSFLLIALGCARTSRTWPVYRG